MSNFLTNCPHCHIQLQCQTENIGMVANCPACQRNFVIVYPNKKPGRKSEKPQKSRAIFMALAFLTGAWGVHLFYAGYIKYGILRILANFISFVLLFVMGLHLGFSGVEESVVVGTGMVLQCIWCVAFIGWSIRDALSIKEDANGIPFK